MSEDNVNRSCISKFRIYIVYGLRTSGDKVFVARSKLLRERPCFDKVELIFVNSFFH